MVVGYGMEEAEQDQYEARLKELFDSFDLTATGSLGQEELTDLCHTLQLDEVAPSLMQTLLQNNQTDRVHFEQFKEALIFILSTSFEGHFSNEENYQEPDSSAEVQPKYIKDGKCYGRRSVPEFCESMEEFPEVTVIEARADKIHSDCIGSGDCGELWKNSTFNSEEYEAEGQLKYWNPDDVSTPRSLFTPTQGWIEDKLQTVCEDLGVTRDGSLSRKELVSIWEQLSIHNLDKEMLEDVFLKLDQDGMMSVQEFFYGVFRNGKPPTPSSSTPYRQLKRHLSTQPFDESGRRTTTPSAMTSTIGFRLFSCLDDGNGYASADQILDMWQEEGIENSLETLKTLDFGLDEKINLTELTMALENELLITKNGIHQAALASFKNEIRHSFARVDQVLREKEKLRLDLEKAEKLKSQMASEVDDHHAAIERLNEYNLRKLDQEYRDRIAALKADLTKERDLVLQQANKQQTQLELEIEKVKSEENYTRDRLTLSLKENSRLEKELLETAEKLVENENLVIKLQKNLDKILNEKFGELDPNSAEFLLQEEKFACLRKEYEQQCRELQDRIDELQLELEEYQVPGRNVRPSMKNSLCEELNQMSGGVESDQGLGSEECHPLNMTLEAEMIIEQIKEQNQQNLENVKLELEDKVSSYEKQLEEMKSTHEKEREDMKQMWNKDTVRKEEQISDLKSQVTELQSNLETLKSEQQRTKCLHAEERDFLKRTFQEEKAKLQEQLKKDHKEALQVRVEQAQECFVQEKEKLIQSRVQLEAEMEGKIRELQEKFQQEKYELEQMHEEQMVEVEEKHAAEKENLENMLAGRNSQLLEERKKWETNLSQRMSEMEARFSEDHQAFLKRYELEKNSLEEHYKQELHDLMEQYSEEKAQWEFEKEEILQENEEATENLKEMLQNEKEMVIFTLSKEKEQMEKSFKDQLNKLILKNQELEKELVDLRTIAKRQEADLPLQMNQLQNELEKKHQEKEELLSQNKEENTKVNLLLKKLENDYEQEKEVLTSKLLILEAQIEEKSKDAEKEKTEMCLEISRLESKVRGLEKEMAVLLRLQDLYDGCRKENTEMSSMISQLQSKIKQLEEDGVAFADLQKVHEQTVKENSKMSSEIIGLQQKMQEMEKCATSLDNLIKTYEKAGEQNVKASIEIFNLQEMNQTKAENTDVLENLQVRYVEVTKDNQKLSSEISALQMKMKEHGETAVRLSELKQMYEEAKQENTVFQVHIAELQEKINELKKEPLEQSKTLVLHEQAHKESVEMRAEVTNLEKQNKKLEEMSSEFMNLKEDYQQSKNRNMKLNHEKAKLQEKVKDLDRCMKENAEINLIISQLQGKLKQLEEDRVAFTNLQKVHEQAIKENAKMKYEIIGLQQKVQEMEDNRIALKKLKQANEDAGEKNVKARVEVKFENAELFENLQVKYDQIMKDNEKLMSEVSAKTEESKETTVRLSELKKTYEETKWENIDLHNCVSQFQEKISELEAKLTEQSKLPAHHEQSQKEILEMRVEIARLQEQNKNLKEMSSELTNLKDKHEQNKKKNMQLTSEKVKLQEKVEELEERILKMEEKHLSEKTQFNNEKGKMQNYIQEIEVKAASYESLKLRHDKLEKEAAENKTENVKLQEVKKKLEEKLLIFSELQESQTLFGKNNSKWRSLVSDLQEKYNAVQSKAEIQRCEIDKLLEENASLQLEIVTLKEEGGASSQKLKELNGSQVEMLQKVEVSKKEKLAAYKMVDRLKKQVADLKLRNEKLNSENAELCQKNSKNQADLEDLKQRLAEILRHKEKRDTEKRHQEEWERERARIKEELQNNKDKSSAVVSSLESALSESMLRNHLLEQEKLLLNQELDDVKQQLSCFEALQNKTANVMDRNEKLLKEKSALNDELNLYAEKVAKVSFLESQIANMKEERQFWEQQSQTLKAQLEMSQEKIYGIDEALQSNNLQMARLKSDLRVTQQEKESLKQEVMSLHKQLQNANDKNQVLELAIQSSGFQNQQKKLYWDDLAHLMEQEQQLLRRENDRLQKEVHNTKGELVYSREKIRQLESTVLTLKHQKHQSQSSLVKAAEQEKLTLKRDYEHLQKELSLANQKVSQMNYLEREIETQKIENEALKNKQVKLERQLMEMLQSNSSLTHRQSQHTQELQQLQEQVCHMVPKDQLIQLQQRLLQAERRSQQLQEELENQAPATPMQQESQEQLLKKMEGRMIDVEQKLRTVRLLLQEKVNQLKEQHTKNTKADEVIKDLYVENSQLLKALELTEQRQKTTERKNYLLEEKIANLNKIVRDLTQCSLSGSSSHHLRS
ncbi:ninein [Latimeria chalumnae]|uniref:ninein n=1 Tax=Latimeria chalumnae TaxID=7897 RepID=UPI0003C169F9|nr:PREDICTED: ninein isoform X2 [Latimeria chalumnae]XP_005996035.1 PREDICTED: ninein isoform X2 [Latimeria chalumnae]|eukprot:XP_005996034.1 PREDICTED: ninein isoform X2 [Latimeria chalumnae]